MTKLRPWFCAVPVRSGHFQSLRKADDKFNVVTDLAQIRAFGYHTRAISARDVLFADLQTCVDVNVPRRLGAGRAGFFKGHYLKGIGRTPLAANWNDWTDVGHGTGHLALSGGVREYVVSSYLRARGEGEAAVQCSGILVGKIGSGNRHWPRHPRMPIGDCVLQAVTLKKGTFTRFSNLLWLLNHRQPHRYCSTLFAEILRATGETNGRSTGADVAQALLGSVERGMRSFLSCFRVGVMWHSIHNNFTVDGRFLDLELATILGRPFIGVVTAGYGRVTPIGFEVFDYLREVSAYIRLFLRRLGELTRADAGMTVEERVFVLSFIRQCKALLSSTHPLRSASAAAEWWYSEIVKFLRAPRASYAELRTLCRTNAAASWAGKACRTPACLGTKAFFLPRGEWGIPLRAYEMRSLISSATDHVDASTLELNRATDSIFDSRSEQDALRRIRSLDVYIHN